MTNFVLDSVTSRVDRVIELGIGAQTPRRGNRLTHWLGVSGLAILGWRIRGELPDVSKLLLIVAPHTSNWDMLIGMLGMFALGLRVSFMAKHTLFRWPLGGIMRWLGGVPVQRHTSQGLVGQMVEAYTQRNHFYLVILPEGTRHRVAQWKLGFYHIAASANVPIVPVKFDYGRKLIEFAPAFSPSGNLDEDLPQIQANYRGVRGKIPQNYGM